MAIAPGSLGFEQLASSPPAPPTGFCIVYSKTDNVLYLKDSSGTEVPLGTASGITSLTGEATATGPGAAAVTLSNSAVIGKVLTGFTAGPNSVVTSTDTLLQAIQKLQAQVSAGAGITDLTGDVTATGPGSTAATVVSVGGKSASDVSTSVDDTQAATASNTASTIVKRDASGNFSANVITASLSGNATTATSSTSFSGALVGDVTGTQGATVVSSVGGKSAAQVSTSVDDTLAATSINTASTIVKRDASGNFAANTITANLTGTASGNEPPIVATTAADYYRGDKTFQPLNKAAVGLGNVDNTSDVNKPVSTAQAAADAAVAAQAASDLNDHITDAVDAHDATAISFDNTTIGYTATEVQAAIEEAQTNIDNITSTLVEVAQDAIGAMVVNTDSIDLTYTDATPELKADLKISSNAEDAGFVVVQNNIETTGVSGLRSQVEADTPVQIGTSNFVGAANKIARADHVHAHGNQTSGTLHAAATTSVNGFMSSTDKTKLDAATDANTASTIVQRDASGNFSAGTITANVTGAASANLLKAGDSMTGYFRTAVVALTDGATINTDASLGNVFTVTIAGNRTFAAPTNPLADQKITYKIQQDATGGRVITWDAAFNFGVDLSGVPNSTSPNIFDYYGFQYNATTSKWDCLAIARGY